MKRFLLLSLTLSATLCSHASASRGSDYAQNLLRTNSDVLLGQRIGAQAAALQGGKLLINRPGQNSALQAQRLLRGAGVQAQSAALKTLNVNSNVTNEKLAQFAGQAIDALSGESFVLTPDFVSGKLLIDTAQRSRVAQKLRAAGVPTEIVEIGGALRGKSVSGSGDSGSDSQTQHIDGKVTPIRAGVRIWNDQIGSWCSLGFFAVDRSGNPVAVTAAHCADLNGNMYGPFSQGRYAGMQPLGTPSQVSGYGTDAMTISLNTTNYSADIAFADYDTGRILRDLPITGTQFSPGNGTIYSSSSTTYQRQWDWYTHYERVTTPYFSNFKSENTPMVVTGPQSCIVFNAYKSNTLPRQNSGIGPGDSGGTVYAQDGKLLGIWSMIVFPNSSLSREVGLWQDEGALCYTEVQTILSAFNIRPITK